MFGFQVPTSADPDHVHYGPIPQVGRISNMCEEFGCLPEEGALMDQDPLLMDRIMYWRNCRWAFRLHQDGKYDRIAKLDDRTREGWFALIKEMRLAQGLEFSDDEVVSDVHAQGETDDDY